MAAHASILSPPVLLKHPAAFLVEPYDGERKEEWNRFVSAAKNATFLFNRDYMDYHHDRFTDGSLMAFHGNSLVAVMAANVAAPDTLVSHGGLTYGGLALSRRASLHEVLACFK